MTDKQIIVCAQCKWYNGGTYNEEVSATCTNPKLTETNKITGETDTHRCLDLRRGAHLCGPNGKHWEKREVTETDEGDGFNLFWIFAFGVLASCIGLGVFVGMNLDIKGTPEVHDANTIIRQNTNIRRSFK